ncbi:cation-translocating P-type ATPase [Polycladomyces subterraneus]|uniref:Cation-translocating P-type ATPase n=1 Tax=Polycladomyces subterraneus TaxID=1016997 RepID=A0ABT8IR82_9BACL|nr:HAD-IC family P-type ATPase [Polycladomyces subterraneus]MDN4594599.1 cation-translocating P-type ATPase [Polycladomyces subterraneus]
MKNEPIRCIHALPGRIRVLVSSCKGNQKKASELAAFLTGQIGIQKVNPCFVTGSMLIFYDPTQLTKDRVMELILSALQRNSADMSVSVSEKRPVVDSSQVCHRAKVEVAASATPLLDDQSTVGIDTVQSHRTTPLPLTVSLLGLGAIGAKQAYMGKSALARGMVPFYLSSLISVATGYPFLKRGLQKLRVRKKWNTDLILGTAAFALALVRENLVVLAGLSIIQYINWKYHQNRKEDPNTFDYVSSDIQDYSRRAEKWGGLLAGATWAVTKDPLRGLAVLLGANPRTATISVEPAWKSAELRCQEKRLPIPENGSLPQLARTKTFLFENDSLLFTPDSQELFCMADREDEARLWCWTATLLQKTKHPWKEEILQKAGETGRTIRTAFHVQEADEGVYGRIQNHDVFFGTLRYLQKVGLDGGSYLLPAKRLIRKGYQVWFTVVRTGDVSQVQGILYRSTGGLTPIFEQFQRYRQPDWTVAVLETSDAKADVLRRYRIDSSWSSLGPDEIKERIGCLRQRGEEVIWVSSSRTASIKETMLGQKIPRTTGNLLNSMMEARLIAERTDQLIHQHVRVSKFWNALGPLLALPFRVSAFTINLIADALSLIFLSRVKMNEKRLRATVLKNNEQALLEVSATSEGLLSEPDLRWHEKTASDVLRYFHVEQSQGLDPFRVQELKKQYGENRLQARERKSWWVSFFEQFKEFSTLLLVGTTALSFLTGDVFHGLAMGAVLLANAAVGAMQERKAEKVVEALNQYQPPVTCVIRKGQTVETSGTDLVPGDVVCLKAGDRVPADLRLLLSWNLEVNESVLTGESVAVRKSPEPVSADSPLSDRNNMLYMGTDVIRGKGIGIVVNTGSQTEMGRVLSGNNFEKQTTPLQERITSMSKTFVKGAVIVAAAVCVTGLMRGIPLPEMISTSIALAASAIPEGLPVTVTIALSAGIYRMARKNAPIRRLSTLETLGRVTVICSDKTGTLTQNEMTVKKIATLNEDWRVEGNGYAPKGNIIAEESGKTFQRNHPEMSRMMQISLLCNNSEIFEEEGRWKVKGDPTEGALLALAQKAQMQENLSEWTRIHEIPFDSANGRMTVACKKSEETCYLFSKGSLESILPLCDRIQSGGQILPLTEKEKAAILRKNEAMASQALRVLAFAYRDVEHLENEGNCPEENNLIFLGIMGMMDPPKPDVAESIDQARKLGVKTVMITGDHPMTAISIAKQIGIYSDETSVITGRELDQIDDEELERRIPSISIFARVTPEHKLRIVTAYQKRGEVVAMTGDGVNDTPAIKQANVGIAMGLTGTEVTKEAADMVLKTDHFASIVEGVKEGRTIISNIRKAVGCLLTGNLAEIIITGAAVIAGLPMPLIPIQILLMNLMTDALPAMILAVNPGNKTKQTRRTDIVDRSLYTKVVTRGALLSTGALGLFLMQLRRGSSLLVAQTTVFATLVLGELIQTLSWRQEGSEERLSEWTKDRFLTGALSASLLTLLGSIYIPPVARFLHTAPLGLRDWVPIVLVAGLVSKVSEPLIAMLSANNQPMANRTTPRLGGTIV